MPANFVTNFLKNFFKNVDLDSDMRPLQVTHRFTKERE